MYNQERALTEFMGVVAEINERLDELKGLAEDHLGYAPEEVTWSTVGTAMRALHDIKAVGDWLFKRGEYAEGGDSE